MPRAYRRRTTEPAESTVDFAPESHFETEENPMATSTDRIASVRIRTGGVHYSGARIVTLLTTDRSAVNIAGSNVITCEDISFHPAGIKFQATANEGGGTHVIPHANIEIVTLA